MNNQELYVDGFGNILVTGTIVRIDLVALSEPGTQESDARFERRQRVVMPLDGFVRAFGMAEDVMKKLVASGVVGMRQPQASAQEQAGNAPASLEDATPASPNFQ